MQKPQAHAMGHSALYPPHFADVIKRGPGRPDTVGHSSVQAWSAGPLFPAVIAVIERRPEFPDFTQWLDTNGRRQAPLRAYPRGSHQHYQEERAEFYALDCVAPSISYELTIGAYREEYATREDAEMVARYVCQDGRINAERYGELMGECPRDDSWDRMLRAQRDACETGRE